MRKIFLAVVVILFSSSTAYAGAGWRNVTAGIDEREFNAVSVAGDNVNIAYVAASGGVYKTKDGGVSWKRSLDLGQGEASFVIMHPGDSRTVYAATDRGLYRTGNSGREWVRVFNGIGRKKIVRCVAMGPANPNRIYIGTEAGLFRSEDYGRNWQRLAEGLLTGLAVYHIALNPAAPQDVYAASDKGLFKSVDGGSSWEKVFTLVREEEAEEGEELEDILPKASSVVINPRAPHKIYLATEKGIFESLDSGSSWRQFCDEGIVSRKINFLAFSQFEPGNLYAATERGVFQFSKDTEKWLDLSSDMGAKEVKFVTCDLDEANSVWITTENGVYKTAGEMNEAESTRLETYKLLAYFDDEPSIREVQEAAVKYAEVYPEKIARWRKAAGSRALLPRLTFGIDGSESDTYEIYTSSATQYYMSGPEDHTEGWDISLTWDLGDLIWNEDQTQIDVRSKLMVQLRDDILDEVTRYYFERRRLEIELLEAPPEGTRDRIRKELRLQELTANIDALTGGYLTDQLGK